MLLLLCLLLGLRCVAVCLFFCCWGRLWLLLMRGLWVLVVFWMQCIYVFVVCEFGVEFGYMFMSSVLLLICRFSLVLYSAESGVKRVHVVFSEIRMGLFACVHACNSCMLFNFKYGCRCIYAVLKWWYAWGVYVEECGWEDATFYLNWRWVDVMFLNVV